jgi:hypothetical protein
MGKTPRRWYVVHYKSKDDPSLGIDYSFSEKVGASAFFPTEQSAHAIQSLMAPGVAFVLADGRKCTLYDFGVEKVDEHKYAIYTENEIPANSMG